MVPRAELAVVLCCGLVAIARPAGADLPPEEVGRVMRLPETVDAHWLWVPDRLFRHSVLFDGDTGRMLGAIDVGIQVSPKTPLWSRSRSEIYNVDT
ncbi:MAG: hypothetical protein WBN38_17050, partial [Polyangiales bacterium]